MALSSPKSASAFVPPSLSSSSLDERNWNASAAITEFYRSPINSTTGSRDAQKNPAPRPPLAKALTPGSRPTQSFNGRSRGMFQVRTLDAERDSREWEGDVEVRSGGGAEERSGSGSESGGGGGAAVRSGRELGRCGSERTAADRAEGNDFSFSTSSSFRETVSLSTDAVTVTSPTPQPESRRSRTLPCGSRALHSAPMVPRDDIFEDATNDDCDEDDAASDGGQDAEWATTSRSRDESSSRREGRSWSSVLRSASPSRVLRRSNSSSESRSAAQSAAASAARTGRAESRSSSAVESKSRSSRARSASPFRRRAPFSGPVGIMLSMIKASASSAAPPPPKADDDDEPLSPTGQVACTLSVFASRLPPLITSFASHRHNNSQENLASLRSAYNASFSRTPPSTTTPSCIPPLFSPLSASLAASSRRGSLSPTPSPSASPSPSPTRSPSASPSASPLPLSPLSKTTPNLRPFPAANVRRSTTDTTGPASGSSSSSGSRNVSAEINITSGSSSSGGSSGVIAGGNRGTDSRKVAGAAPAAGENQSGMQVRSRSFNGNVDGPVSPLAASPVPVSPLSARFEPSRRNEFSRRDDSIGSATCIYAHAHTFTSANPPLSSSGPRSASLERSPESYGVKSAVSNADMYAFCPLAVASSTPGRRPPRRGPGGSGSFSGRYARSPSPQRAAQPAAPVEPLRLGPLIVAIGQADVTAIRDAVKAVRAAIKATPENKKRLIQAGGVQFLINLVAESPDGDTVEHAVTVLYNVCREEGGRDAIVSGAEGGLEALVKALRAEKSAARENAAAALFCLAWGIQTVSSSGNGGGKGGRGSRGPSPSRPTRGRSTSVGAVSMSPSVSARSSPHTPSLPPSPALKSPTASTTLLRPSYDSREFSGVFSGAGNSPSQPEGALQAAAGVSYATAGAGEEAGSTEAAAAGEGAAATAGVGATAGAADATAGAADATAGAANATAGAANATAGGADAMADGAGEQGKLESTPPQSSTPFAETAVLKAREQLAEIKLRIGKAGAIPALVEIFLSGSTRGKIDAVLAVLALLSGGEHHRELLEEFLNSGGLNILLNMVQESNEDLENRAMALVSFIACSSTGRRAIKEAKSANGNGGLEVIADVLDLTTSQKARQEAVSALLLLARHDEEARKVIGREGVVPALHRVTREATGSAGDKAKELLVLLREQSAASGQLQAAA